MDFATIKEKFAGYTKTAVKKSNEIIEITKIHFNINETESDIAKKMREIGELVYTAYRGEEQPDGILEDKCREIDDKNDELEALRAKLAEIKNVIICPNCKKELEPESKFCSQCGEKFDD